MSPQNPCGCCLFKCCSCVNFNILKTKEGIIKLFEIILGLICQNLLIHYSLTYSMTLGSSYYSFLTTISAGILTSTVLLLCYLLSNKSYQLLRQSLFETLFNGIVSFMYLSSSSYFAFALYTFLYPLYKITSVFQAFPTMSSIYIIGFIVGIVHGYDSWLVYKKIQ
ncbi:conserved hypothetical protein [Pediculus humanus corporis]|uniref:MARVEL domain-containing protein n=1 Tax=Pediculus humanus subsp. corporis TaxID=121224 RepID=E0V8W3_PEDHC|nr:uncharacterized protein Phum_PHUM000410 [Pediculus humanus corporis]EEB09819.1 conserved hypothetical protein [Pediculus humanus corporis]